MEIFETCKSINALLIDGKSDDARNELIKLLDFHEREGKKYDPIVNNLIRQTGLFPYMQTSTSLWEDQYIYEVFKVNTGGEEKTLHIEQSSLLRKLLEGRNIAVSAPTSFGKSFVIDAFISIRQPKNVVLIVPTLALTDETRRRLYKKFSNKYKIITTPEVELGENNILIFPQERSIQYISKLTEIDILIIDEFYKASITFDKDRAPILLKAILELSKIAKQRYFLAPNIASLNDSPFTQGMDFIRLNFNTVFSEIHALYKRVANQDDEWKKDMLIGILQKKQTKSLIYAGTFTNIDVIANVLNEHLPESENIKLYQFSEWLKINYHPQYVLTDLVKKRIGIHNGQLHRSLSQIQVRMFEEEVFPLS